MSFLCYYLLQALGFRKFCFDYALGRMPLSGYNMWLFDPKSAKGTYREYPWGSKQSYYNAGFDYRINAYNNIGVKKYDE